MFFVTIETHISKVDWISNAIFTCQIQIVDGHLEFIHDLGSGDKVISLPHLNVSDGLWHTVYIRRYGNQAILKVDGGEGRYYNESEPQDDFRLISLSGKDIFAGAEVEYRPFHSEPDVAEVFENSKFHQ